MALFKRGKPPEQRAPEPARRHPAVEMGEEMTQIGERIQEFLAEIGKDFSTLVTLAEALPESCRDLKDQQLSRQRLYTLVMQELARNGLAATSAAQYDLQGKPTLAEEVRNATRGIESRVLNDEQPSE